MRRIVVFCGTLLLAVPASAAAQQVRAAVAPDTARVGDVVLAAVRVELPVGWRATFPDSLPVAGAVENAGRRRETVDTLPGGGRRVTVAYPVSAWRPGKTPLPVLSVRIVGPGGERVLQAALPPLTIRSVLPEDTAGIEPRPAKGVLGPAWLLWPFLVGLLGLVAGAAGFGYWLKRRRGEEIPFVPATPPRDRALEALDRARALGLVEVGEFKAFYSLVTEAVRSYLEALDAAWGEELTTSELLGRLGPEVEADDSAALAALLGAADLVKFARRRPTTAEAYEEWAAARAWVEAFGPGAPEQPEATAEPAVEAA